jgi:acetate---CoA ligase (ADP-forming)
VLDGTTNALAAVRGVLAYRDFRERLNVPDPVPAVQPRQDWANTFRNGPRPGALPEDDALSLLADFGIPVVRHRRVSSAVEAVEAARQIGFPVALKTAKPGVTHKSEHGGVALSLRDAAAVADAYGDIEKRLGPDALVTAMMTRGIELSLGMVRDPDFGAIVTVGAGGVLIELLADRRVGLAPFGSATARRLFDATRIRRLLDGYRGSPNVDLGELSAIVARFSAMASILASHIDQIDVNPLWCGSTIAALDALVLLSPTSYEEPLRWI